MIDREHVLHIARLSRLALSESEVDEFTRQLGSIIDYVNKLESAPTGGIPSGVAMSAGRDTLRDDTPVLSPDRKEILQNGPCVKDHHFAVPKVIG